MEPYIPSSSASVNVVPLHESTAGDVAGERVPVPPLLLLVGLVLLVLLFAGGEKKSEGSSSALPWILLIVLGILFLRQRGQLASASGAGVGSGEGVSSSTTTGAHTFDVKEALAATKRQQSGAETGAAAGAAIGGAFGGPLGGKVGGFAGSQVGRIITGIFSPSHVGIAELLRGVKEASP
jgi:hypothetical protein